MFPCDGVDEAQCLCVETLAVELGDAVVGAIHRVARHGMLDGRHVDADLMGAARLEAAFQQPEGSTGRITISNGIVEISYRSIHTVENSVYDEESYVQTKDEKYLLYLTYYTYTFTDDCFKDGTPIGNAEISIETVGENRS